MGGHVDEWVGEWADAWMDDQLYKQTGEWWMCG